MKHNKLVRDKILEIIAERGESASYHVADEIEYAEALKDKLREEVEEFLADESIEELADVLEVIDAIAALKGYTSKEIASVRQRKNAERGGFSKKIILDEA